MAASTSTAAARLKQKPFREKLLDILKEFPDQCDVTFSVGLQQIKIKSLRVALIASSPAIHAMFTDRWDSTVRKGEDIPLPDFEPGAFDVFLKILTSNDWSAEGIQDMNFSAENVIKLIEISKQLKVLELEQSLQESTEKYFENFRYFAESEDFFQMPRETLEIVLSSNRIDLNEIAVFDAALKWAEWQCSRNELDPTGENLREALGPALFQIRFPLMSFSEFGNVVCGTGILWEMEEYRIFKFISLSDENKATLRLSTFDIPTSDNSFIIQKRQSAVISSTDAKTLHFFTDSEIVDTPPFTCDGDFHSTWLSVDTKIAVESVGFLGPIDHQSIYEVFVQIQKLNPDGSQTSVQKVKKTMTVNCKEKFEVAFHRPAVLEATYTKDEFNRKNAPYYIIDYYLKGNDTQSVARTRTTFRTEVGDIGFYCQINSDPKQLPYLKFKRVEQ